MPRNGGGIRVALTPSLPGPVPPVGGLLPCVVLNGRPAHPNCTVEGRQEIRWLCRVPVDVSTVYETALVEITCGSRGREQRGAARCLHTGRRDNRCAVPMYDRVGILIRRVLHDGIEAADIPIRQRECC